MSVYNVEGCHIDVMHRSHYIIRPVYYMRGCHIGVRPRSHGMTMSVYNVKGLSYMHEA